MSECRKGAGSATGSEEIRGEDQWRRHDVDGEDAVEN
jgi:hypothetical protein